MKATRMLHEIGQSLWLDNISRNLLDRGALKCYIDDLSFTGLTASQDFRSCNQEGAGRPAARRRHEVLRKSLERPHGGARGQERGPPESELAAVKKGVGQ